jgi:predicted transcriptional regulator
MEIIDAILRSIKSGVSRTQIMYKAFLSHAQLKEYLKILEDRGLVRYEEQSRLVRITERGVRYMNVYEELAELVPSVEHELLVPEGTSYVNI